jgi:hypothetical protein
MEMRYLRRLEGKTSRDKVRNQTIRLSLGAVMLQSIEESQLRWFGRVCRMNNERYPKWCGRQDNKGNDLEEDPDKHEATE